MEICLYTTVQKFRVSKIFFCLFFKKYFFFLFSKDGLNLLKKNDSKTCSYNDNFYSISISNFYLISTISISNKLCSFELDFHKDINQHNRFYQNSILD